MRQRRFKKFTNSHLISIVVPAYKAEKFIKRDLLSIRHICENLRYKSEVICIVDGYLDKTLQQANKVAHKYPKEIRVFGYSKNQGKGYAVKYGMSKSKGDIIAFIDAGLEINPNGLGILLEHFIWYNADIIVGSKLHPASKVNYPWQRKIVSFGYRIVTRLLFGLKIRDTQAGIKFYRREVLEKTLPRLMVKAFAFDIEMLAVAYQLGFKRIYEAPVELKMEFKSGISTITSKRFLLTVLGMFLDTCAVFYRLYVIDYYNDKNHKNWTPLFRVRLSPSPTNQR